MAYSTTATFKYQATMAECFKPAGKERGCYRCTLTCENGPDRPAMRMNPTPELMEAVKKNCTKVEPGPSTITFELHHTREGECHLYWHYVTIMSGDYLTHVAELDKENFTE